MSPTEASASETRGRQILLIVLGVVLAGALIYAMWPAASAKPAPSNQTRLARKPAAQTARGSLDIRLEDLKQPPPQPADAARNPFRFYVKPPPPPPPPKPVVTGPPPPPPLQPGQQGYVPPPPPPIPLKFIGTMEQGNRKVAIFSYSDGRGGIPVYAKEGEAVLGQYRLVKIGVESVVMEYLDGRGRQTIPMRGQ